MRGRFVMDVRKIGMGTLPAFTSIPNTVLRIDVGPASAGASVTPQIVQASQDVRNTPIDPGPMSPYYGPGGPATSATSTPPPPPASSTFLSWLVPVLAAAGGAALGAVTVRALLR